MPVFSTEDLYQLQDAQRALLQPVSQSLQPWADDVCSTVRRLVGTKHVYYYEPDRNAGGPADVPIRLRPSHTPTPSNRRVRTPTSQTDDPPGLLVYCPSAGDTLRDGIRRHFRGFKNGFMQFREAYPTLQHRLVRSAGTGAFHDAPLHDWAQRDSLQIYQEVFRPLGVDRKVALSTPLPIGEALLIAGFSELDAPEYNGRRHRLLQMLVPAYEASLRFRHRLSHVCTGLARVLDEMPVPLLVFDADAKERHRNAALKRLLSRTGDDEAIVRAAQHLARGLRPTAASDALPPAQCTVTLASGTYTLRGHHDNAALADVSILVSVDRASALPSPPAVANASALTPRESEVAVLLAEGLSDQKITDQLHISIYTVRRHVSRVLRKLNLSSRAGVALALLDLFNGKMR